MTPVSAGNSSVDTFQKRDDDFEFARKNIHDVIEVGHDALTKLSIIADSTPHPRVYEVIGQIMKTLVDANHSLMDLQKKNNELNGRDKNPVPNVTNNNMFVGSTQELQELIKKMRSEESS